MANLFENNTFIPSLILYLTLLIGAAIYFVVLVNKRNRKKITSLRSDWTNRLHQDIGGDLSSIKLRLSILERKLKSTAPPLLSDLNKTQQVVGSIERKLRFLFDLIDNQNSSLNIILADVGAFAEEHMAIKGINFHLKNKLPEDNRPNIDIIRINKLYLAIKEVVNNCVKYSKAKNAHLLIDETKGGIRLVMEDDGIGFDTKNKQEGNGLKNLRQYSEEGSIHINIQSQKNKGTKIEMVLFF